MTLAAICSRRRSAQGRYLVWYSTLWLWKTAPARWNMSTRPLQHTTALDKEKQPPGILRSTQQELYSISLLPAMACVNGPFSEMISIRPCDARKGPGVAENAGLADVLPV
jgi:hypothetical protein